MSDLAALETQLTAIIRGGPGTAACERCYSEEIVMPETAATPVVGKARTRHRAQTFFGSIAAAKIHLLGSAVGDGVSYSEWIYELDFKDGRRISMNEVSARRWKDGLVVHERFYYNPAG